LAKQIEMVEPKPSLPRSVSSEAVDQIQGQVSARLMDQVLAQFPQGHIGLHTLGLVFDLTRGLKINPILHRPARP
jgi:hypothetical protein